MKQFDYSFNIEELKLNESERKLVESSGINFVFESVLGQALQMRYKDGVNGLIQRTYGRILSKLDKSQGTLSLEQAEFDLIKDILTHESVKFHPSQTRLITKYLDVIEKLG